MSPYFCKPYEHFSGNVVELDLSNYVTKADIKVASVVDTSNLTAKSDLASLKAKIDKLQIDKIKTVPSDLCKLSNIVGNGVIKKLCLIN